MCSFIPFLALLAISALHAMLLLQSSGNVAPLGQPTGLEDVLQQPVLLGRPRALLHYINIEAGPIKNNIILSEAAATNETHPPPTNESPSPWRSDRGRARAPRAGG